MGKFFNLVLKILGGFGSKSAPSANITAVLRSGYDADKPILRTDDRQLSDHFFLSELTHTDNPGFQAANRTLSDNQIQKLIKLARHGEAIRSICGGPVRVHSAYRCPELNGATNGSSSTSQHPRCEAMDLDVPGQSVDETFQRLYVAAKAGRFQFGQLILEEAHRGYQVARWVHCSEIGTLTPAKVGQVLRMKDGAYELLDQIKFEQIGVDGLA